MTEQVPEGSWHSRLLASLQALVAWLTSRFDLNDLAGYSGLAMLGYGFGLWRPWAGWAVVGGLLFAWACFVDYMKLRITLKDNG